MPNITFGIDYALKGSSGNDSLQGGGGNDELSGAYDDDDVLLGGRGNDLFVREQAVFVSSRE